MTGIQPVDAVIRVAALDGTWETVGADRLAGISPQNIQCSANPWGSDKASFDLRRDPGGVYPDLSAFTPVDIEVGGVKVWSGRVSSTPSRDGSDSVISVQCEGWQYHLDDDVYERRYVHTNLTEWQDIRGFTTTNLASYPLSGSIIADSAGIALGWRNGTPVANVTGVMVGLDLGAYTTCARIVVNYDWNNASGNGNQYFYIQSSPTGMGDASATNQLSTNPGVGALTNQTQAVSPGTPHRYVWVGVVSLAGGPFTASGDLTLKINSIKVFAATAYESGNASILKASDVVSDSLTRGTIFLTDTTGVTATSFSIPEYAPDNLRTPREHIDAVNAYHAWRAQVSVDRKVSFQAPPSTPLFEAGEWSGCEIADASMNDGDEIYSRCIVEAAGPDGVQMRVERTQAQQSGTGLSAIVSPVPDNPTFATNTTSWTAGTSTITRDTGTYDSSPASGRWDNTGASDALGVGDTLTETFTGTFLAGVTYTLTFRWRASATLTLLCYFGQLTLLDYTSKWDEVPPVGSFGTVTMSWTPTANRTGVTLAIYCVNGGGYIWIDSLQLFSAQPTIVDRRGFRRTKILPVQSALTTAAAQQIADTYLSLHRTTPYRGSITVTPGGIRTHQTGQPVHPATLLTQTQEKIRLTHRINPDDGSVGRDGTIAAVTYDHDAQTASIDLDNRTTNFEAFLSRLSLLTGQVR